MCGATVSETRPAAALGEPYLAHQCLDLILDRLQTGHRLQAREQASAGQLRLQVHPEPRRHVGRIAWPLHIALDPLRPLGGYLVGERAHLASIGKPLAARPVHALGHGLELRRELVSAGDAAILQTVEQDLLEQFGRVIVEGDDVGPGKPATQARVGVEEIFHLVRVSGHDDDEPVPVVLHPGQQSIDRLAAEPSLPLVAELVRLVDEQHAVERAVDNRVGLYRGLPDVLANQVARPDLSHVPASQHPEVPVHLADQPGHRGLAGAGVAGEDEVVGPRLGVGASQAPLAQFGVGGNLPAQPLQVLLHRVEPSQAVQLVPDAERTGSDLPDPDIIDECLDIQRLLVVRHPAQPQLPLPGQMQLGRHGPGQGVQPHPVADMQPVADPRHVNEAAQFRLVRRADKPGMTPARPAQQPAGGVRQRGDLPQPVDRRVHVVERAAAEEKHAGMFGVPPVGDDVVRKELGEPAAGLEMPKRLLRVREHDRGARCAPPREQVEHLQRVHVVSRRLGAVGADSSGAGGNGAEAWAAACLITTRSPNRQANPGRIRRPPPTGVVPVRCGTSAASPPGRSELRDASSRK